MRLLMINEANKKACQELVKFASREENWYAPGNRFVPGDRPEYCLQLESYRCVFTHTKTSDGLFRHLSISVPKEGAYPHPFAAYTIAELFGFTRSEERQDDTPTSPGSSWQVATNQSEGCIVMAEKIK